MTTAPTHQRPAARGERPSRAAALGDVALALLAHLAVGASWGVTSLAVMGSLDVARRMVMNSEFAWDTGRLPQPWVIPLGLLAALASHWFFAWAMRRVGRGRAPYSDVVVAFAGAFLGVALGAYLWTPALLVGAQVGPQSGVSKPWGILGWSAHYARLGLPAVVGLLTVVLVLFSRHSPLVVFVKALVRRFRRPRRGA